MMVMCLFKMGMDASAGTWEKSDSMLPGILLKWTEVSIQFTTLEIS